jgi:ribosome recycling factor
MSYVSCLDRMCSSPGMLDRLMVNYYGTPTPINQVARITTTGAMQLTLEPFDREMLNSCEACTSTCMYDQLALYTDSVA